MLTVLNLCPAPPEAFAHNLDPGLDVVVVNPVERSEEAVLAAAARAQLVIGDWSGEVRMTAPVIAAMDAARLFHQFTVGLDSVDVAALTAARIPLTNAGDAASVAMAEHSVMATLALLKSLAWSDRQVRAGGWPQHEVVGRSLVELRGRTVGLIGLGASGTATARRLAPFGCTVLYTARTARPTEVEQELGVVHAELDDLLARSDVVIVLADLNPSTHHLLDDRRLRLMKPGSFLVNPARAGVVDDAALLAALDEGRLGGASIDVAEDEPPSPAWPFRAVENALLTPHTGGATLETRLAMIARTVEVIEAVARGALPSGVLNGVDRLRDPDIQIPIHEEQA